MFRYSLILVAAVAACSKPPSSIAPVAVAQSDYHHLSCSELAAQISVNSKELSDSERRQRNMVAADAAGVFLVLIPPSAFTGDASADVALNKGEDIAMRKAFATNCGGIKAG